jgi:glyoxylase-like metal-dependent hydrolase (beta-lactamase superfamily II)
MAFAPDVHVFPGGAIDPGDGSAEAAALRELAEEVGVALSGPDALVPLARWVTPRDYPRRFDVRFFAAELPRRALVRPASDEVAEFRWLRPTDAIAAMARGSLPMWLPTSVTLQHLEHAHSFAEIRDRLSALLEVDPGPPVEERITEAVVRLEFRAAGSVPGRTVNGYLVGQREITVVDPGDPSERALDTIIAAATRSGGAIRGICVTHVDPDHVAGAEALAERLDVPVFVGPGGGTPLPFPTVELSGGELVPGADIEIRAVATPGPRPDHLAFAVAEGTLIAGDLVGDRPSRSLPGPADASAWRRSLTSIGRLGAVRLLPGHGGPISPSAGRRPRSGGS